MARRGSELTIAGCASAFCCMMGMLAMLAGLFMTLFALSEANKAEDKSSVYLIAGVLLIASIVLGCVSLTCRYGPWCTGDSLVTQEFSALLSPPTPTLTDGIPVDWTYQLQQQKALSTEKDSYQDLDKPDQLYKT